MGGLGEIGKGEAPEKEGAGAAGGDRLYEVSKKQSAVKESLKWKSKSHM